MKKLFIILIAGLSFNAVSAQSWNDRDNKSDRYQVNHNNDNNRYKQKDYAYNSNRDDNDRYNRQVAYDRMNQQYDKRISGYRNDRALNRYERDRRIREAEIERQQQARSFGKGLVVGGLAAIAIGILIGH